MVIKVESKPKKEPVIKAERPSTISTVKGKEPKVIKVETTVSLSAVKDGDLVETEERRSVSLSLLKEEKDPKESHERLILDSEGAERGANKEDTKNVKHFSLIEIKEENEPEETGSKMLTPLGPVKGESRLEDCKDKPTCVGRDEEWPVITHEDERKDEKRNQEMPITETELKTEAVLETVSKTELGLPEPPAESTHKDVNLEPSTALEDCQQGVLGGSTALNILAFEYAEETTEDMLPSEMDLVKQEKEELSTDEDINVDYILDCLDFVKGKKAESTQESDLTMGTTVLDVPPVAVKPETEPVPVSSAKPKPAGKRVTWNLQDADQSPTEKTGSKC